MKQTLGILVGGGHSVFVLRQSLECPRHSGYVAKDDLELLILLPLLVPVIMGMSHHPGLCAAGN